MNRRSLLGGAALAATTGLADPSVKGHRESRAAGRVGPMSRFSAVNATNGPHRSSSMAFNW